MGEIVVLIGVRGSGKTTWAMEQFKERPDKVRILNMENIIKANFGYNDGNIKDFKRLLNHNRLLKEAYKIRDLMIDDALAKDYTVIIDDVNLTKSEIDYFHMWNVETYIKTFNISIEEAISRDIKSGGKVGPVTLGTQIEFFKRLFIATKEELLKLEPVGLLNEPKKDKVFLFDIDGTLAHKCDRDIYDLAKVQGDHLDEPVYNMLLAVANAGYTIIICTGRDEKCKAVTDKWLMYNGVPYHEIMYRKHRDARPDWIVKEEMWRNIAARFEIMGLIDDRLQVVRRARALGLKVFSVDHGNF